MIPDEMEPLSEEAIARLESLRREALQVGYPRPDEVSERIPLIGRLSGRAPTTGMLLAAKEIFKGLQRCAGPKSIIQDMADPSEFYEARTVSLRGKGREELVKIAAGHPPAKSRRTIRDAIGR